MVASFERRKINYFWVKERNRWREKYSVICDLIRVHKRELKNLDRCGSDSKYTKLILDILKQEANQLMIEREAITIGLKMTEYKWE